MIHSLYFKYIINNLGVWIANPDQREETRPAEINLVFLVVLKWISNGHIQY